jgi:signal transduction histidine kinase
MFDLNPSRIVFLLCSIAGIGLLGAHWFNDGYLAGFFAFIVLVVLFLFRLRVRLAWTRFTVIIDVAVCLLLAPAVVLVALFWAMYHRVYFAALAMIFIVYTGNLEEIGFAVLGLLAGVLLGLWEGEYKLRLQTRDTQAGRYYELENLQMELRFSAERIEHMTQLSERARIAREIHDNAGHEIVAAYITLQAVREGLEDEANGTSLERDSLMLFDAALERLDQGMQRIREAVHNLAPVAALGVQSLRERCESFPGAQVDFTLHGDSTGVSVHVWNVLESILNEALTNATRHARPSYIRVSLDATPHLVRLCVENDGTSVGENRLGSGLRNLRYRAASVGGSLAVDAGEVFKIICVIPLNS